MLNRNNSVRPNKIEYNIVSVNDQYYQNTVHYCAIPLLYDSMINDKTVEEKKKCKAYIYTKVMNDYRKLELILL